MGVGDALCCFFYMVVSLRCHLVHFESNNEQMYVVLNILRIKNLSISWNKLVKLTTCKKSFTGLSYIGNCGPKVIEKTAFNAKFPL